MQPMTLAALATPPVPGAVGILRLSGPAALEVGRRLAPQVPQSPAPRHAYLSAFVDAGGQRLDEGLFLYFQAPRSFTGEDVVELHAHGSPRLLRMLLARALEDPRVRPAGPGEFTRRALASGRLDLARAEAVADLVEADSEAAVRAAAAGLAGALSSRVRALEEPLRALHADLEGALDFPDEAEGAEAGAAERVAALAAQARALGAELARGRLVRRGARVVLYGPVNAGKSTLFNRLLGEERALVDAEPGTTRDVLEARVEWEGLGLTLLDTAGLREEPGRLEALGIARTREALRGADLAVLVLPPGVSAREAEAWRAEAADGVLVVYGKADTAWRPPHADGEGTLRVSGLTGEGVERLRGEVLARLWGGGMPGAVLLASERHADALRRCSEALARAEEAAALAPLEVVSGEVGLALEALGEVSGTNVSEALLDTLFARFCIGK
ncbi:tRNA modification GTPase [Aggregicoccus sp. 17bor-14]|uniref:tRNA modification GTPase n=1 Tax=Myxococcaceae TaxID=31 RepID=UPI00129CEB09|nr:MULTISPECIES: tRNA modification GTPase [Myxococcaceae]MBF5045436.1 tRNA modification GTPase [Simulacricoccus sp. 17bor-14]MRI91177.1 tRNA modification GTPase [Aggregicoccus sp. 17bor-14]